MLKRGLLNQPQTRVTLTYQNLIFCHSHEEKQGIGSLLGLINMANLDDTSKPSRHFTNSLWAFWPMCGQFNNPRWKNVKALTLLGLAAVDIRVLAISNVGSIQSKIYINTYVTLQIVGSQWQKFILLKSILQKWPNYHTRTRSRILNSTSHDSLSQNWYAIQSGPLEEHK